MDTNVMASVFDEWAKRYSENPSQFDGILDDNGNPFDDYGMCCAVYFKRLLKELSKELNKPPFPPAK